MSAAKKKDQATGNVAVNKKAYFNFELVEKYEAGIELKGSEVKSLRSSNADLSGSYARIQGDECWLIGANIAPYEKATHEQHDPLRKRKLLMHKQELRKIRTKLDQRGFTFVPLRVYFNSRGLAKVEVALARGKRQFDKRSTISDRQQKRDVDREMKKYR